MPRAALLLLGTPSRRRPFDLLHHNLGVLSSHLVSVLFHSKIVRSVQCFPVSHLHHDALCGGILPAYPAALNQGKPLPISNQLPLRVV